MRGPVAQRLGWTESDNAKVQIGLRRAKVGFESIEYGVLSIGKGGRYGCGGSGVRLARIRSRIPVAGG